MYSGAIAYLGFPDSNTGSVLPATISSVLATGQLTAQTQGYAATQVGPSLNKENVTQMVPIPNKTQGKRFVSFQTAPPSPNVSMQPPISALSPYATLSS
eukprot:7753458-Ditylum_brightwellii.AAC.1